MPPHPLSACLGDVLWVPCPCPVRALSKGGDTSQSFRTLKWAGLHGVSASLAH